jgi:hypothetical protein
VPLGHHISLSAHTYTHTQHIYTSSTHTHTHSTHTHPAHTHTYTNIPSTYTHHIHAQHTHTYTHPAHTHTHTHIHKHTQHIHTPYTHTHSTHSVYTEHTHNTHSTHTQHTYTAHTHAQHTHTTYTHRAHHIHTPHTNTQHTCSALTRAHTHTHTHTHLSPSSAVPSVVLHPHHNSLESHDQVPYCLCLLPCFLSVPLPSLLFLELFRQALCRGLCASCSFCTMHIFSRLLPGSCPHFKSFESIFILFFHLWCVCVCVCVCPCLHLCRHTCVGIHMEAFGWCWESTLLLFQLYPLNHLPSPPPKSVVREACPKPPTYNYTTVPTTKPNPNLFFQLSPM